jgi:hypothetical protein
MLDRHGGYCRSRRRMPHRAVRVLVLFYPRNKPKNMPPPGGFITRQPGFQRSLSLSNLRPLASSFVRGHGAVWVTFTWRLARRRSVPHPTTLGGLGGFSEPPPGASTRATALHPGCGCRWSHNERKGEAEWRRTPFTAGGVANGGVLAATSKETVPDCNHQQRLWRFS